MGWLHLEEATLPEFHIISTIKYHVSFKSFWEQNHYFKMGQKVISKCGSFDDLLFQSGTEAVVAKWVNIYFNMGNYFKVGQKLL